MLRLAPVPIEGLRDRLITELQLEQIPDGLSQLLTCLRGDANGVIDAQLFERALKDLEDPLL